MTGAGDGVGERGERPRYYVAALGRGLAVLARFSATRTELTLADIAEAAGVTSASALRTAYTMTRTGFLIRNPVTKGYRLGPQAVAMGLASLNAMPLPQLAEPSLARLRDAGGGTVKLGVPENDHVVIVSGFRSLRYPAHRSHLGVRMPLFLGSLGRAILAWQDVGVRSRSVSASAAEWRPTPRTLVATDLRRELEATRRRGYSFNDQGVTLEHRSVGAPIRRRDGTVIASVNLSQPTRLVSARQLHERYAPLVLAAAAEISSLLPPNAA
ncbi:IclR family transcriptional regulator [Streptomyces sp. NPDC026672]|uniref:IclR family transcriptional regulator n=1 Tax=unclassified Streptomyces TaxID=2593676 RepID=UPI003400DF2F